MTNSIKAAVDGAEAFDQTRPITDRRVIRFRRRDELDGDLDRGCARLARNDSGNAERFLARHAGKFLMVRDVGLHAWVGTHWSLPEGETRSLAAAQEVAVAIHLEAATIEKDGRRPSKGNQGEDGYRPGELLEEWEDRLAAHRRWAATSGNVAKLRGMIDAAMPHLTVELSQMDRDPYLINVRNGTLRILTMTERRRLRTEWETDGIPKAIAGDGARQRLVVAALRMGLLLKPHDPEDRITKCAPVEFDPFASAPRWRRFLRDVQPKAPVRGFLRRAAGYCATADTSEQVLFMNDGHGSNGKSTFADALRRLLGDFAVALPFKSLVDNDKKGGGDATPDLARLPGARFTVVSEAKAGMRLDEALIKGMTGGEPMMVRQLNKPFVEFMPTHKLWCSFNHRPNIRGQDHGIWRRVLLVRWEQTITNPDKQFMAKLDAEMPGILNWVLRGAVAWRAGNAGLDVPEMVRDWTATYRSEMDRIGGFVESRLEHVKGQQATAKAIYAEYSRWAADNAADKVSQTALGIMLNERGFISVKRGIHVYLDTKLHEAPPDPHERMGEDGPMGETEAREYDP